MRSTETYRPMAGMPGEWADRGACRGYPTEWWYPAGWTDRRPAWLVKEDEATAMRICRELCPVRAECLVHAIKHRELGLWGATTNVERRQIRLKLRGAA